MRRYFRRRRGRLRRAPRIQAYSQKRVRPPAQKPRSRLAANATDSTATDAANQRRAVARGASPPTRPLPPPKHASSSTAPRTQGGSAQGIDPATSSPPSPPPRHPSSVAGWHRAPVTAGTRRVHRSHTLFLRSQHPKAKRHRCKKARRRSSSNRSPPRGPSSAPHPNTAGIFPRPQDEPSSSHPTHPTPTPTPATAPTRNTHADSTHAHSPPTPTGTDSEGRAPRRPDRHRTETSHRPPRRLPRAWCRLTALATAALFLLSTASLAPTLRPAPSDTTLLHAAHAPTTASPTLLQSTCDDAYPPSCDYAEPSGSEGDAHSL